MLTAPHGVTSVCRRRPTNRQPGRRTLANCSSSFSHSRRIASRAACAASANTSPSHSDHGSARHTAGNAAANPVATLSPIEFPPCCLLVSSPTKQYQEGLVFSVPSLPTKVLQHRRLAGGLAAITVLAAAMAILAVVRLLLHARVGSGGVMRLVVSGRMRQL